MLILTPPLPTSRRIALIFSDFTSSSGVLLTCGVWWAVDGGDGTAGGSGALYRWIRRKSSSEGVMEKVLVAGGSRVWDRGVTSVKSAVAGDGGEANQPGKRCWD